MAITEEEKIRRREIIEKNFNIVGAGFGEEIAPEVKNMPCWEQYINGDITLEELNNIVRKSLR